MTDVRPNEDSARETWNRRPQPAPDAGLVIPEGWISENGLQVAIEHGFTEEQYRAAKRIEFRIFGPYQWQSQEDRAASMMVAICAALKEAEERGAARPPVEGDGWRTIESAPRDGTPILAIVAQFSDCVPAVATWQTFPKPVRYAPQSQWRTDDAGDYCGEDLWLEAWRETRYEPTHWMPLPAPPAQGRE